MNSHMLSDLKPLFCMQFYHCTTVRCIEHGVKTSIENIMYQ